jgi:hypothetical protein
VEVIVAEVIEGITTQPTKRGATLASDFVAAIVLRHWIVAVAIGTSLGFDVWVFLDEVEVFCRTWTRVRWFLALPAKRMATLAKDLPRVLTIGLVSGVRTGRTCNLVRKGLRGVESVVGIQSLGRNNLTQLLVRKPGLTSTNFCPRTRETEPRFLLFDRTSNVVLKTSSAKERMIAGSNPHQVVELTVGETDGALIVSRV